MTDVRIIRFELDEPVTCDGLLLADHMLKTYCDFICDDDLDSNEPVVKPDTDDEGLEDDGNSQRIDSTLENDSNPSSLKTSSSNSLVKQLTLARSCLTDVIYAAHCLGPWCTKRTIKIYITEFSRILNSGVDDGHQPVVDVMGSTLTALQCFYARLEEMTNRLKVKNCENYDDLVKHGSSLQLRTLLHYIKDHEPPPTGNWPICIVHVHHKVIAKVIALWLREVALQMKEYSFMKPNYMVGSSRKHRNKMAVDTFDLHHEAAIRDFRFGKCNTLVISSMNERCADMLRCNLVISFDFPSDFGDFLKAKMNCRNDSSKYIMMLNQIFGDNLEDKAVKYLNMEKILNSSNKRDILDSHELELLKSMEKDFPPYPQSNKSVRSSPATVLRSVNIINKYCAKLPSDSFTKLSPEWSVVDISNESDKRFICTVRLPINSPIRQAIFGPPAQTKGIAIRLAAFTACKVLHKAGELDDNMLPVKKDSIKTITPWLKEPVRPKAIGSSKGQSLGSTKHRQYYRKRIAKVFSGPQVTAMTRCFLYRFKMTLTCPIPDEQNRRGRRIIDPSETSRNYAIICANKLPKICSFPVFTRSGEVMISVECVEDNLQLTKDQVLDLRTFHEYTFSKVLRLEKYPTIYDPENSPFAVLLAPVNDDKESTSLDWDFVSKIIKSDHDSFVPNEDERKKFTFKHDDYLDAVVIPWYRLTDRQQFAYYVAEICTNMSPQSPFPDETSGFKTFIDYYKSKYDIAIYNEGQPVLDVDHTSARLNLLTPRYVNRKGKTLPSSTAKTRRESRDCLDRKQLLIPELCTIHPFPASFWRKAVCLPAIFYRLNSLFLAEELRREVAGAIKVGFVEPPENFKWPDLDFGWSLKDVINAQSSDDSIEETSKSSPSHSTPPERKKDAKKASNHLADGGGAGDRYRPPTPNSANDFVIDHFDPSKLNIPDIPLDAPPNEWMNIKLISTNASNLNSSKKGWDQELVQHDLLLHHSNEVTWDDCEMHFDGELSEKPADIRCGSPSNFETSNPKCINGENYFQISSSNAAFTNCSGAKAKAVTFQGSSKNESGDGDEDDDDEDDDDDLASAGYFQDGRLNDSRSRVDSDSSWTVSDDDYIDDDEITGTSNALYGDWREEKTKRQSRLRELFVPYLKRPHNENYQSVEDLYEEAKEFKASGRLMASLSAFKANANMGSFELLESVKSIVATEESEQNLISILNDFFENVQFDGARICKEGKASWRNLYVSLRTRYEETLKASPELFKDEDIALISVDDSPIDLKLGTQPTFGQLLPNREISGDSWPSEEWKSIKFDPSRSEIGSTGPGPSVILQALTMSNASDGINLERLETVGDSFLKYSITAYLYCMYPKLHEGKLSYLRSTEISNANLYQLGRAKNLGEIMSATKFEPNDNWLPPGYTVADTSVITPEENGVQLASGAGEVKICQKKREIDKALAEVPYDLLRQHSIPDKSIADCVEALIGAYLTASGSRAALLFMQWLGLRVVPPTFDLEADLNASGPETDIWRWLDIPPSPLIYAPPSYDEHVPKELIVENQTEQLRSEALEELNKLYREDNMDKFEEEIQYKFKDKAYLVQAFTHNSFHQNHVTDCHQRLEFLGDALLDYLITRYLFEDPRCHSPGTLTDLRSALVNNTFFASLAVKYNFHKYLKYISDDLSHAVEDLVKKFRFNTKDTITKGYTLLIGEGESEYAEDIEVPKALGDVFESVAGAIYLDSGMSLDQVWQVYFEMMKPEIEYFSRNVPKSPIRELLESKPQNVRFSPSELAPDKKHRVTAEVFGLGRFTGVGRSKHSAKSTAAKRALRMLEIRKNAKLEDDQKHQLDDTESESQGSDD